MFGLAFIAPLIYQSGPMCGTDRIAYVIMYDMYIQVQSIITYVMICVCNEKSYCRTLSPDLTYV